ncbi:MAG: endonuclease/exonuclease/phosphatase family protein [Actinoplanes sp.]
MTVRLATFNVENLFSRAKALDSSDWAAGEAPLAAFALFNRLAQQEEYSDADKEAMLQALETLNYLVRTPAGRRVNPDALGTAWAVLRENRGDFLVAPAGREPRIVASGRSGWIGWAELTVEPVDDTATRMTARVIGDVNADVLCVVEAESRPSLVHFNEALLGGRYAHTMLVDGNDLRGIDVGLFSVGGIDIESMRSHVDTADPARPGQRLFSRDCPLYQLRLPSGETLHLLVNHLKSQSMAGGDPDPLRTRQATQVRVLYDRLRAAGAQYIAVLGDLNKGPDRDDPKRHPTLEALLGPDSPLVSVYDLDRFRQLYGDKDPDRQRPGSFQSCSLTNRLDYILVSPELAAKVTDGGVFRKGLWGTPSNTTKPSRWTVYDDLTSSRHAASDHAAVWVDLDV